VDAKGRASARAVPGATIHQVPSAVHRAPIHQVPPEDPWRVVRPDGTCCVLVLRRATRFLGRLRGLLGQELPAAGHGLWLEPCRSVHSFGMRGRIDLLFIDRRFRVVARQIGFAPRRVAGCRQAYSAIELRAGEALRLRITVGARLEPHAVFFPVQKEQG
jgi:uncharacterized membrane protein (UPF0127 family)